LIVLHHLNDSRSQRVLWLLEELELPYEIRHYQRDATTRLAPPELLAVNPVGKSPVIEDAGLKLIESGAIIDYLIRRHGGGRLQPDPALPAYDKYQQWMHYAEGSAMLPLMMNLYLSRLGDAAAPLMPRVESEIANHLGHLDRALATGPWLLGDEMSGADVQMSFVGELAGQFGKLYRHRNLDAWVRRFQARPAYQRAVAKGGPYHMARTVNPPSGG
jgi:glutathione S-transferase